MKKLIALLLALVMVVGLVACGGGEERFAAKLRSSEAAKRFSAYAGVHCHWSVRIQEDDG